MLAEVPNFAPISPGSLRNANGLTAADLAHAQGFWECAQLLSNAQNHLNQLNGFHSNGALNGHRSLSQSQGLLNGLANRKRLLDGVEPNHIKKARRDGRGLSSLLQGLRNVEMCAFLCQCADSI